MGRPEFTGQVETGSETRSFTEEARYADAAVNGVASGAASSALVDSKPATNGFELITLATTMFSGVPAENLELTVLCREQGTSNDLWRLYTNGEPLNISPPVPYPSNHEIQFSVSNNGNNPVDTSLSVVILNG